MSEEQIQEKKSCKCILMTVGVVLSLLMSIAALTLSILAFKGTAPSQAAGQEAPQVVISKQYDKGRSLEKALATKKPVIVFFYTDWCGFCQRFAPTFDKITKTSEIKKNFAIAYVNCEKEENQKLMQEYEVQGFPTVYVIDAQGKKTMLKNETFFDDDSVKEVSEDAMEIIGK